MRTSLIATLVLAAGCGGGSNSAPNGAWHYALSGTATQTGSCRGGALTEAGSVNFSNGVSAAFAPSLNVDCNSGTCTSQNCAVPIAMVCTIDAKSNVSCPVTGGSVTLSGTCSSTGQRNNQWNCTTNATGTVTNSSGTASYSGLHMTLSYPL
jgi:hypothetical protein